MDSPHGENDELVWIDRSGYTRGKGGFTLLEVLLAIFILGIIVSTVYAAFSGTLRIVRDTGHEGELYEMARSTFDWMARDLTSLVPYRGDYEFRTESFDLNRERFTRLNFRSRGHISYREKDLPEGVSLISYDVVQDVNETAEGLILIRSDAFEGAKEEEEGSVRRFPLCRSVKTLSYTFIGEDGTERDAWDSRQSQGGKTGRVPVSVLVVLELVNPEDSAHPYRFMTRIFLPASQDDS